MKRVALIFFVIVMITALSVNVFADTASAKDDLIGRLKGFEISVKGTDFCFDDDDISSVEKYLAEEFDGEIDTAVVEGLFNGIDSAMEIVKNASSYTDASTLRYMGKLAKSDRAEIVDILNGSVKDFGLCAEYDTESNKLKFIKESDGKVAFESDAALAVRKNTPDFGVLPMLAIFCLTAITVVASAWIFKITAIPKSQRH